MSQPIHVVTVPSSRTNLFPAKLTEFELDFALDISDDLRTRYETIAGDPKYAHFVRIPERISRCLDYFRVGGDRLAVSRVLRAYYLFIGVIDQAIDSGATETGSVVFYYFNNAHSMAHWECSDVTLMTVVLKNHIRPDVYLAVTRKLHELYEAVVHERSAGTIESYIETRKKVGRLTAEVSYLFIRPFLKTTDEHVNRFMQRVGAVGCLVDSVIDLRADSRLGLLCFAPTFKNYAKLTFCTLREGFAAAIDHPRMVPLFLQAITDNVRDLFRRKPSREARCVLAERKKEVAV